LETTLDIINNFLSYIKKHLALILIFTLVCAGISFYIIKQKKTTYKSYSKIFPLSAEGSGGPLSSLKSELGINDGDQSKYYNVNELVNSRNLSRKVVTYPTNNSAYKTLYDWVIADFNKQQFWKSDKITNITDTINKINIASDIYRASTLAKKDKTEFTSIECTTSDEALSLRLNEVTLQCLSDFYIESKTVKAREDVKEITFLKDSLKGVLDALERQMAGFTDNSQFLVKEVAGLPRLKLERIHEEVLEQYSATASALQNANFKLLSESPIFQVLDYPTKPLNTIVPSKKKAIAIGAVLGALLGLFIAIRKPLAQLIKKILLESN
jgi:hypothetical protein